MDVFDQATELEEKQRELSLRFRKPELLAAGVCHYCGTGLGHAMLFCDQDCRDDWQYEQDARKRNGR